MLRLKMTLFVLLMLVVSCANMGATNTTSTNIAVTSYEAAGITLTQAYNLEKALFKAGTITAEQDAEFQLGPYTKAVTCYRAIGSAAVTILTATDQNSKATAQDKFTTLNAQLPTLLTNVLTFIQEVQK
jgi:hypothetical protein